MTARGAFEVKLAPQAREDAGGPFERLLLEKQFQGDLEGASKGQMLGARGSQGSGGYVAMELVTGVLGGRHGSFMLQHSGTMSSGGPTMQISVVPDSGTGELAGIAGSMTITIDGGKHLYEFSYALTEK